MHHYVPREYHLCHYKHIVEELVDEGHPPPRIGSLKSVWEPTDLVIIDGFCPLCKFQLTDCICFEMEQIALDILGDRYHLVLREGFCPLCHFQLKYCICFELEQSMAALCIEETFPNRLPPPRFINGACIEPLPSDDDEL